MGLLVGVLSARAQSILITINQYHPDAVTFTTTGNPAIVNDSSEFNLFGVDLVGYFTSGVTVAGSGISGDLTPAGTTAPFNNWFTDNYLTTSNEDVNLYVNNSVQLQSFSTTLPAFTGSATINLATFLADLPATGSSGPIYSGYSRNPGVQIGTWIVVPEPSSLAQLGLGGLALVGIMAWRGRRGAFRSRV